VSVSAQAEEENMVFFVCSIGANKKKRYREGRLKT
jgi:hypothetical protein